MRKVSRAPVGALKIGAARLGESIDRFDERAYLRGMIGREAGRRTASESSGWTSIVVALTVAYLPSVVRVVRASVLSIRTREYLEASRVMGNSTLYSMLHHVVPNTLPQVGVLATSMFGWVLLSESALSFLGVGIPAPAPTWGNMFSSAKPYLNTAGSLAVVPGLCIVATVLGTTLLSDALRDRFDPRVTG